MSKLINKHGAFAYLGRSTALSLMILLGIQSTTLFAAEKKDARDFKGIGRPATTAEISAWNIDVRPDFKGLPVGSGSVAKGQEIFEARCASCHGSFAESGEVTNPLVGGTTKDDIKTGHAAGLINGNAARRSTIMQVSTISTIWDYIYRAMPWNAPKSLTPDDVYGVTAYILNQADIVPEGFVLSNKNIAEVQAKMPNRNGMTLNHGFFTKGKVKSDTRNIACMKNCETGDKVASFLPDYARNAHGDLALQNRQFGAIRGTDTTKPAPTSRNSSEVRQAPALAAPAKPLTAADLLKKNNCTACHAESSKLVGPAFADIRSKYASKADASTVLLAKVKAGGSGVWGEMPMPAQGHIADNELQSMLQLILKGN